MLMWFMDVSRVVSAWSVGYVKAKTRHPGEMVSVSQIIDELLQCALGEIQIWKETLEAPARPAASRDKSSTLEQQQASIPSPTARARVPLQTACSPASCMPLCICVLVCRGSCHA